MEPAATTSMTRIAADPRSARKMVGTTINAITASAAPENCDAARSPWAKGDGRVSSEGGGMGSSRRVTAHSPSAALSLRPELFSRSCTRRSTPSRRGGVYDISQRLAEQRPAAGFAGFDADVGQAFFAVEGRVGVEHHSVVRRVVRVAPRLHERLVVGWGF